MKIHYLQHVPFEGPGYIEAWAGLNNCRLTSTKLYENELFPDLGEFDWLIVMGGPMSVHDTEIFPWLAGEKRFIKAAITAGKPVLGICLGAQLIANVLEARVYKGKEKEIGWFPINRSQDLTEEFCRIFPEQATVFHWHGETFEIPRGAVHLAQSAVCTNQGFIYRDKVVALQFHLESTKDSVAALIENCADELVSAPFIQTTEQMLITAENFKVINGIMDRLLSHLNGLA
jgi:GMP synthase (glutamine-hydrolysing)